MGELVLVTGGTGYIATYIIAELLEDGYQVRTTVRDLESPKVDILRQGCGVDGRSGDVEIVQADLSSDDGWAEAVDGCAYIIHTASPVGDFYGKTNEEIERLVQEAIDGTLRAFNPVKSSGTCKRIVLTSSVAAVSQPADPLNLNPSSLTNKNHHANYDETDWADMEKSTSYQKSKVLAERAAWDFASAEHLEMVAILPSFVIGPSLTAINRSAACFIVDDFFLTDPAKRTPFPLSIPVVDVRDVAKIHVSAMTHPKAANERFIAHAGSYLPSDFLPVLQEAGYKHVPKPFPAQPVTALLNGLSFIPAVSSAKRFWGTKTEWYNNSKVTEVLDYEFLPLETTILDYAKSAEETGLLPEELRLEK